MIAMHAPDSTHVRVHRASGMAWLLLGWLAVMVAMPAWSRDHHRDGHRDDDGMVAVGHDVSLSAGQQTDNVVAILGSASSDGEVGDSVVAVLGSTHVTGPTGQSVVSVLGDSYVDGPVGGDVVAVLGDVELGPHAVIGGEVTVVGGALKRDPGAIVGGRGNVVIGGVGHFARLQNPWIRHCLLLGRPLALDASVSWAWGLAFAVLVLYLLASLVFHREIDRGVRTFEQHPAPSLFAALLMLIGIPIILVIVVVTVIGVIAVPFLLIAIVLLEMFGKIVMLSWIGRRLVSAPSESTASHAARTVLIGGLIVLALYVVPVLGFVVYKLFDLIGLGVLAYSWLLHSRGKQPVTASSANAEAPAGPAEPGPARPGASPDAAAPGTASPGTVPRRTRLAASEALMLPRAGFWLRMAALLLDCILVGVVLHLVAASTHLFLVVLAAYGAIMWKARGSTVGGLVCGLEVIRSDGSPMDWSTALVRALGSFVSLIVAGLGFIWIAVDADKRAWHDKIAGTLVVRIP
jgi:uncharacterized RDD family membrane protein YckC